MKRHLLILKTGSTLPDIRAGQGDFEDWFRDALNVASPIRVVDAQTDPLPDPLETHLTGLVITGSPSMLSHNPPWALSAMRWVKQVVGQQVPVLGICFGHQLLARALGGEVGPNPRGRQIGTQPVSLLPAAASDALFARSPSTLPAQMSHLEAVLELPPGATLLASSPRDPHHAFRWGDRAWGLQFHPEFSDEVTRGYIRGRKDDLIKEGSNPDLLESMVKPTPLAYALVRRFALLAEQLSQESRAAAPAAVDIST